MSGPVRSVLRQSASMDDYTRDRRNSVRFADQAAPSQALDTFQQLAVQQQHPNLQQQQQQAGAVMRNPLQVQQQQQQQSHQGFYPCPSMTATASQLGNPQVGYASNNASASNVSANNNGAATSAMQQQAPPGSPPQVLSPSQLSSFALQIAAQQQQQQQQPVPQQQFVFQGSQQQAVLSPTLTSHSPQVMFNYSAASAQHPQHVVQPQNGHHGWQQTQQQQQQTSAPIFVKNNDQFSPLSIANTDDPKWHKWVELINQYWNEMAALDEQSRFQMICNLSILAAEKE